MQRKLRFFLVMAGLLGSMILVACENGQSSQSHSVGPSPAWIKQFHREQLRQEYERQQYQEQYER